MQSGSPACLAFFDDPDGQRSQPCHSGCCEVSVSALSFVSVAVACGQEKEVFGFSTGPKEED